MLVNKVDQNLQGMKGIPALSPPHPQPKTVRLLLRAGSCSTNGLAFATLVFDACS